MPNRYITAIIALGYLLLAIIGFGLSGCSSDPSPKVCQVGKDNPLLDENVGQPLHPGDTYVMPDGGCPPWDTTISK